jgi:hypothetical protein
VTLVADPARAKQGITAEVAVPKNFDDLLESAGQIGGMYGNQKIGPYPAPHKALARSLAEQCSQ